MDQKKNIKQNLINSANALAAAADALLEAANDLQTLESQLQDLESYSIEQEQLRQTLAKLLTRDDNI